MPSSLSTLGVLSAIALAFAGAGLALVALVCVIAVGWEIALGLA